MITTPITHAETAWIAQSVPLWLTVAAILASALLLRGRLALVLASLLERRGRGQSQVPPALVWTAPITTPEQLLLISVGTAATLTLVMSFVAPLFLVVVLASPLTALLIWLLLTVAEARYVSVLERALPAAVARLGTQLAGGSSFRQALEAVLADLGDGPLRAEWLFLIERQGVPLVGGIATPTVVVAALLAQTPSRRHQALLTHLEVALGQTQDVLTKRVQAAASALFAAEQRRSAAATELAQMRYSGVAIGLAGLVLGVYLLLTQAERVAQAYTGPLGLVAGLIVGSALLAPIVGGVLLSRIEDLEY